MIETALFVMAGASYCMGVLVGSGLHTRSIDRKYQRLAQLVRHLNEQDVAIDAESSKYLGQNAPKVAPSGPIIPPPLSTAG